MPFVLTMPKLSPTMEHGVIANWHKKEGEWVNEGDVLFEVATDKATVEYRAVDEGFLRRIVVNEGQEANVNDLVAIFSLQTSDSIEEYIPKKPAKLPKEEKPDLPPKETPSKTATFSMPHADFTPVPPLEDYTFEWPEETTEMIKASPLAKKEAKKQGLNLATVKGSGPSGRVVEKDLKFAQKEGKAHFGPKGAPTTSPGSYIEEEMSQMRRVIGEKLQASKMTIPHFYIQMDVDASPLASLREELKSGDVKVTFNDLILRGAALTLKRHPKVNSGFDAKNQKIIRFETIDIAIAVSVDGGLITPIIRHADYKNVGQLSKEVKSLATKAKEGHLKPHEYQGGSFTLSNLGMYGVRDFQAVINPPQGAILAVGAILDKPVVKEGQVIPGKVLSLSLSSDHRVIDGADAAIFMKELKEYLENPSLLLI